MKALWSPHTGIVDWGLVTQYYGKDFEALGGQVHLNFQVDGFKVAPESQQSKPQSSEGNKFPVRVTGSNGVSLFLFLFLSVKNRTNKVDDQRSSRLSSFAAISEMPLYLDLRWSSIGSPCGAFRLLTRATHRPLSRRIFTPQSEEESPRKRQHLPCKYIFYISH